MPKRILAVLLTMVLCCSLTVPAAMAAEAEQTEQTSVETADAEGTVSYANLEQRVRKNNLTALMLQETIASIDEIDFDKMYDDTLKMLNSIAKSQHFMLATSTPADNTSLTISQLQSSYSSMKTSFDDLRDGKVQRNYTSTVRQLENTQDQLVMGAQSLYVALLEMEDSRATL